MKTLGELIGASLMFASLVMPVGCVAFPQRDLRPFVSAAGRYSLMQSGSSSPAPDKKVCENCRGTGKVGDGRVSVVCPVCKGTGK